MYKKCHFFSYDCALFASIKLKNPRQGVWEGAFSPGLVSLLLAFLDLKHLSSAVRRF